MDRILSTITQRPHPDKAGAAPCRAAKDGTIAARLRRMTLAFSKKLENVKAAVAVHIAAYNFSRVHKMLRLTPAMTAVSPITFGL
jgi:hypothetical protein